MVVQQVAGLASSNMTKVMALPPIVPITREYRGQPLTLMLTPDMNFAENSEEISFARDRRLDERQFSSASVPQMRVKDILAVLKDSAEELTFSAAEKMKPEEKEKAEKAEVATRLLNGFGQEDNVQQLLDKLPDLSEDTLNEAVKQLLEERQDTPKLALTKFLTRFSDVSHQYVALLKAKAEVSESLSFLVAQNGADGEHVHHLSQLNSEINTQLRQFVDELGEQVRAGINISIIAEKFVSEFEQSPLGELRQLYRDCVLNYEVLWEVYKKLTARFGKKKFRKSCAFLEEALVADMEADGASICQEKLAAILKDIYQLRILGQLHDESDVLYKRLKKKYFLSDKAEDSLSEGVIEFFDGAVNQSGIQRKLDFVVQQVGIKHIVGRINLITGIKNIVRLVPIGVFRNDAERVRALETIQKTLDIAIENECEA